MTSVLHIQKVGGVAGSENHLLGLLPGLRVHGYEPAMLVLADRHDRPEPFVDRMRAAGIPTDIMPMHWDLEPMLVSRLVRFMRQWGGDIVHTHLFHADLYGAIAARQAQIPALVSSMHNDNPFRRRLPIRALIRWNRRLFDRVICISHYVARSAHRIERVSKAQCSVVHYGLAIPPVAPVPPPLHRMLGLAESVPLLGMVARLIEQKGHYTLLQALAGVARNYHGAFHLVIIGDGTLRLSLEATVGRLGLTRHVTFLGHRPDAAAYMPAFDLFVHPSRWEGFGLVFLEAMAAGLPIVGTRAGAIPEIVEHGQTGFLVPVDDPQALSQALIQLLMEPELGRRMGRAGRQRLATGFTLQAMWQRTADVYADVLQASLPVSA